MVKKQLLFCIAIGMLVLTIPVFAQASDEPPTAGGPQGENIIIDIPNGTINPDDGSSSEQIEPIEEPVAEPVEEPEQTDTPVTVTPPQEPIVQDTPVFYESATPSVHQESNTTDLDAPSESIGIPWNAVLRIVLLSVYFIWNLLF